MKLRGGEEWLELYPQGHGSRPPIVGVNGKKNRYPRLVEEAYTEQSPVYVG